MKVWSQHENYNNEIGIENHIAYHLTLIYQCPRNIQYDKYKTSDDLVFHS